jgi:hypothetical protein
MIEYLGLSHAGVISTNKSVSGTREPLAKLGTVVATVALRLVPNYSAAIVTNRTQYPMPKPRKMTNT